MAKHPPRRRAAIRSARRTLDTLYERVLHLPGIYVAGPANAGRIYLDKTDVLDAIGALRKEVQ